ncbi:MAG: sporulation transcriptional regulator SpoIIID [Clostridia bacterium]|nr:sporulation transcriptional regulator SpoIIID [Clostridia bacterium]
MGGKVSHNSPLVNLEGKKTIEERACSLARYIIDSKDTVRGAARKFGISKSTVHKDVSERLLKINPVLAIEVRKILDENKAERHIRGGMATKLKYTKKENAS